MQIPNLERLQGTNCNRVGCLAAAAYLPVFRLYAPFLALNSNGSADLTFAVALCANCAAESVISDFLDNEEDWNFILQTFERAGLPAPEKSRTEMFWQPIFTITIPANLPPELEK